jgi:hypothetical protein
MKTVEISPIPESHKYYDELEKRLKLFLLIHLYKPLLKELNLPKKTITNARSKTNPLESALFTGELSYNGGSFSGKITAAISKELRALGARFNKKNGKYKLPYKEIPESLKQVISGGEYHFHLKMQILDQRLGKIVPEELAAQFKCADIFDKSLWQADKNFRKNVKKLAVVPKLTQREMSQIATLWQNNTKLSIQKWTKKQIKKVREKIFTQIISGASREDLLSPIQKITRILEGSHQQALNKAKFIARQENRLLMAAFKQTRYEAAGSKSYIWHCVNRPKDKSPHHHVLGNVRYSHGILDGKTIEWASPPITSNPGQPIRRNHAGQDWNCRCFSRPLVSAKQDS